MSGSAACLAVIRRGHRLRSSNRQAERGLNSTWRIIGGFGLVIVGIIGLILPIMPGWIFLIPGLVILSERFIWAKRLVTWAKEKSGWKDGKKDGEHSDRRPS